MSLKKLNEVAKQSRLVESAIHIFSCGLHSVAIVNDTKLIKLAISWKFKECHL